MTTDRHDGAGRSGPGLHGVVVMSHGTPRSLDGLAAFYTEIRRGRPPTPELLEDLERRYRAIGGVSPLNDVTRAQASGIARSLQRWAPGRFLVASGAKFADPRIEDAVATLARQGARHMTGLVLAPHSSTVSVGEYARRAKRSVAALAGDGHERATLTMVDHWYDAPGFAPLLAERVHEAITTLPAAVQRDALVVFTAHSVPSRLAGGGDTYAEQVHESAHQVASRAGLGRFEVAWQSAGRTDDEWLGPDVLEVIASSPRRGARAVVVCPIGFVSDHLEVLYDIDVEARAEARRAGVVFARTRSLNDDPRLCELLAGVVAASAGVAGPLDATRS